MPSTLAPHIRTVKIAQVATPAAIDELIADPGDGYQIVVLGISLSLHLAGSFQFLDSAASPVALTGDITLATNGVYTAGFTGMPLFRCTASEPLRFVSTTGAANGFVTYTIDAA